MIRHIVFFTARRREDRDAVLNGLSLLTEIPHAQLLEIGTNGKIDQLDNEVDFIVYGEFDDEAALAAYKAHPLYQLSIDHVRPIREMRLAADYDTDRAQRQPVRDPERA
ncbi:MAG: Dabb family protein [Tsuneonella sp.]